jgi:TPR repeat protein
MALLDRLLSAMSPAAALRRAVALTEQGDVKQAFPLLTRAARAGIAEAEYRVGRCYLEGSGVPPSRIEGVRWHERAANQGYVEAQAQLATLAIHGLAAVTDPQAGNAAGLFATNQAVQADFETGIKWARKAADGGSSDGQAVLGYILTSGPEALRNLDEAKQWYERSANAGCPQGALGYALSLAAAATDQERQAVVADYLRRAADAGLPTALYLLGIMTERGLGLPADRAAAIQLFRLAAEKGNRPSQARWGVALMEGQGGVEANPIEGESWLRRAALAGDPEAAAVVGDMYAKGGKLPPNYAEAAIWFRRAAETGHRAAARALGLLHLTGAGVPRDAEEAARWFSLSAQAGDPNARVDLANLLLRGEGAAEDAVRTREWFEQAAASGDLVAAFNFGVCLAEGVGVERDDRQAAQWLRRAADGVVNAQYWYGRMLNEGRGLDANPEEGRAWIQRAADVGMVEAEVLLAEMMLSGRGGARDHLAALALFEKAAGRGHVGAMFALGAMHGGGHDIPTNRPTAQRWFHDAADRGHAYAQMMLGRYLSRGLAGERDVDRARVWLERALAQGLQEARGDLAALPPSADAEEAEPQAVGH